MWTYPPGGILVAVDFGAASDDALRVSGDIARAFDANLTVLHSETFDAPPYFTKDQIKAIELQRRAARRDAVRYLSTHAAKLAGGAVDAVVSDAAPADAILDASRDLDLIVMGTHGRRGPARWWAGSVAERVAREAAVPVLVVRAGLVPATLFKKIVVVARGGTFDGAARRYAKGLAATFAGDYSMEPVSSLKAAALQNATLVVLARPSPRAVVASGAAERALRACDRPVLLVPCI